MDNKTKGAWIVHHKNKLDSVSGAQADFEEIALAGKCSILLSAISNSNESTLENEKLNALATANGISKKIELPQLLSELEKQRLITRGDNGIDVIGVTTSSILEHTTKIFEDNQPNEYEKAVIDISERVSESPMELSHVTTYISDIYKLDKTTTSEVLERGKRIGFFDYEKCRDDSELIFNGNLFRNEEVLKISKVMSALAESEIRNMREINSMLDQRGCIPLDEIMLISGTELFSKLQSIGFYDVNSVSNEYGSYLYVTKPSSFCKFTSSIVDDAFDLAKAFVTSLTYGMLQSSYSRGRINMIEALMNKLILGQWVGPATAIGHDYKMLELKGVIKVKPEERGMFYMKLLKKDVGQLALAVIQEGTVTSSMLSTIPGASISNYLSPEFNRSITRRKASAPIKKGISDLLDSIRTGGF